MSANSKMKYAIIEHSGKQFWIEIGRYYHFNYIPIKQNKEIILNRILLMRNHNLIIVGKPYLKSVLVRGEILNHLQFKKILVYKMKSKKKTRKRQGYRQQLTRVLIKEFISFSPDYKFYFSFDSLIHS